MTREILKMLNHCAVDYPMLPVNQRYFPPYRDPGGMRSRPGGMLSRKDKPPDIWDSHGISGNVFCKSTGVFFITLSKRIQSLDF